MTARTSPAVARNTGPILEVLRRVLPRSGTVLEIASGTGEHAVAFARAFPDLRWRPSDGDAAALESVRAWRAEAGLTNLLEPLRLDAATPADWDAGRFGGPVAAAVCINMIHIAPWRAAEGLFAGTARVLEAGAPLYLYGPFREAGRPFAPSNAAFDESLRARDPAWGVRDLEAVAALAAAAGLRLEERIEMPANNLSLVFRRTAHS